MEQTIRDRFKNNKRAGVEGVDVNGDGVVDVADLAGIEDINGDGEVDAADYAARASASNSLGLGLGSLKAQNIDSLCDELGISPRGSPSPEPEPPSRAPPPGRPANRYTVRRFLKAGQKTMLLDLEEGGLRLTDVDGGGEPVDGQRPPPRDTVTGGHDRFSGRNHEIGVFLAYTHMASYDTGGLLGEDGMKSLVILMRPAIATEKGACG